ncbi:MAG: bifunctional UDP-N-acetylglucosamine diphosphorylase/glucosamine-1-phosphate N-acetyltransferase GlmU, partial [Acidobacteriota bacterium]|nr:bifunctional UDP-N-acetylglucosamine diphosphorylase/glucosamine-1-phosphate N-acetyltransferase GlmU [Acidobacteriota bacterium]
MNNGVTVVILAAGLGTRMRSRQAKVLHRAGGQTLLDHAIDNALAIATPERIFVVVGYQAAEVRQSAEARGVRFILQAEQRGTGHALMCGQSELQDLGGLLVVFYGDCPLIPASTLRELVSFDRNPESAATMATTMLPDPAGYGRIIRDAKGNVQSIVEQKAGTPEQLTVREVNPGIYCFRAGPFWKHVGEIQPNNAAHEYYLTDMIEILIRAGYSVQAMPVAEWADLLGINNRVELAAADRVLRERKARELMLDGVTIEKPETVMVDKRVRVGMDTVIGPFAQLLGDTVIGEGCRIGACSIVSDSELGDDVEIGAYTIIGTSRLAKGAHAGPFSRLRMENSIGEGAHIGNFVELKKATIGAGAKAMHLAYLGDATIGAGTNIGA